MKKTSFPLIVILFSILGAILWVLIIPYNGANDEFNHYDVARFIADKGHLPIFNRDDYTEIKCVRVKLEQFGKLITMPICQGSYSIFPMPSYLISALFISPISEDSQYRYIFARLPGLTYFIVFLALVWKILKKMFSSNYLQNASFLIIALIPQITFINAYVNSDGLSLMAGAFVIYFWVSAATEGLTRKNIIIGSIALGILASVKYNYFILFPATAVFLLFSFFRFGWKRIIVFTATSFSGFLLISGWWFARNYVLYGDALGFSTVKKTFAALAPDYISVADLGHNFLTVLLITNWNVRSFESFFALFGWMSIELPSYFYIITALFVLLALFGWLFHFVDLGFQKKLNKIIFSRLFPLFAAFLFAIAGVIYLSVWTALHNDFQPQGRYLFPALIPIMIVIIKGIQYSSKIIRQSERLLVGFFAAWMTILWIFSYLMLVFYYEGIKRDPALLQYFQSYNVFFLTLNNNIIPIIIFAGSIALVVILWKIWKIILRSDNTS